MEEFGRILDLILKTCGVIFAVALTATLLLVIYLGIVEYWREKHGK